MGFFDFLKGLSGKQGEVKKQTLGSDSLLQNNNPTLTQSFGSFKIIDVYNIRGVGVIPVGKIMSGQIAPGMKANVNGKVIEIKSIERNHQQLSVANSGDDVGMSLKNANVDDLPKGQVINFSRT